MKLQLIQSLFVSLGYISPASGNTIPYTIMEVRENDNMENEVMPINSDESTFNLISRTGFNKVLDCLDGYIYSQTHYYKSSYTNNSNLYLIHIHNEYSPGVAIVNTFPGIEGYDGSRFLGSGSVNVSLERYTDDEGNIGGQINPVVRWPQSSTFNTTVSSSFGSSFSANFTNGIQAVLGTNLSISRSYSNGLGINISYSNTISSSSTDPVLNSQMGETNMDFGWSFYTLDVDLAGAVTYNLDTYILFEMDNYSQIGCSENAFIYTYHVSFRSKFRIIFDLYGDGSLYESAIKVVCFR